MKYILTRPPKRHGFLWQKISPQLYIDFEGFETTDRSKAFIYNYILDAYDTRKILLDRLDWIIEEL